MFPCGPADATAIPKPRHHSSLASFKSRLVIPFCVTVVVGCLSRPFFTYWVTVVQIICFIASVAVFGIAHIGGAMTTVSDQVRNV